MQKSFSPLGYRIMLDRYAQKDIHRNYKTGDTVVYKINNQTEWGVVITTESKSLGVVPFSGTSEERDAIKLDRNECDRCLETTWEQIAERVADGVVVGPADEFFDSARSVIQQKLFIPAGRILAGCGTGQNLSFYNCFVLPSPHDSRAGIFRTLDQMAEIMSRGGGVGINLASLRPHRAPVYGVNGRSSGAVSWGGLYSYTTGLIEQGGSRRGALMLILPVWHPDVEEFITCKTKAGNVTNANISVAITDEFMECVKCDSNWDLEFPDYHSVPEEYDKYWKGDLQDWLIKKFPTKLYRTVRARELWQKIMQSAWESAEPGVWFQDVANNFSPSQCFGQEHQLICTNPCVTGDTLIATIDGPKRFDELVDQQNVLVYAWNPQTRQTAIKKMIRPHKTGENQSLLSITFDSGLVVKCTPNHSFYTTHGRKIKAEDLQIGNGIKAFSMSSYGDGQRLRVHGAKGYNYSRDCKSNQPVHRLVWEYYHGKIPAHQVVHHKNGNGLDNRIENLECVSPKQHNQIHYPNRKKNGLDGWKPGEMSAEIKQKISQGVKNYHKKQKAVDNHKVIKIESIASQDVYNGMVEDFHTYVICDPNPEQVIQNGVMTGIVSANCGEQPLPAWGVCNLGHINLAQHVTRWDKPVGQREFDWEQLKKTVQIAVCFLDRIIDKTPYFFEENRRSQQNYRRVGLGTLGLAEMLVHLGFAYGNNPDTLGFVSKLYRFVADTALSTSVWLGHNHGSFDIFDEKKFEASNWFHRASSLQNFAKIYQKYRTIRNITLLTQAPCGTVATMLGTTTGIEPYFAFENTRTSRLGTHIERASILQEWIEQIEKANASVPELVRQSTNKLPSFFVTSADISVGDHIAMQSAIQHWTDTSISKTVNLPNGATVQDVTDVYEKLYQLGCKGGTVYRDGSRSEQVLNFISPQESKTTPTITDVKFFNNEGTIIAKGEDLESIRYFENPDLSGVPKPLQCFSTPSGENSDEKSNQDNSFPEPEKIAPLNPPEEKNSQQQENPFGARSGYTMSKPSPSGTVHVIMNDKNGEPFECFVEVGKSGSEVKGLSEALGRLVSLIMKMSPNATPQQRVVEIINQLNGIGGTSSYTSMGNRCFSIPDAVAQALEDRYCKSEPWKPEAQTDQDVSNVEFKWVQQQVISSQSNNLVLSVKSDNPLLVKFGTPKIDRDLCPECGNSSLRRIEGCNSCDCGYSRC